MQAGLLAINNSLVRIYALWSCRIVVCLQGLVDVNLLFFFLPLIQYASLYHLQQLHSDNKIVTNNTFNPPGSNKANWGGCKKKKWK